MRKNVVGSGRGEMCVDRHGGEGCCWEGRGQRKDVETSIVRKDVVGSGRGQMCVDRHD